MRVKRSSNLYTDTAFSNRPPGISRTTQDGRFKPKIPINRCLTVRLMHIGISINSRILCIAACVLRCEFVGRQQPSIDEHDKFACVYISVFSSVWAIRTGDLCWAVAEFWWIHEAEMWNSTPCSIQLRQANFGGIGMQTAQRNAEVLIRCALACWQIRCGLSILHFSLSWENGTRERSVTRAKAERLT